MRSSSSSATIAWSLHSGLQPFDVRNIVTRRRSGAGQPRGHARAAFDAGIRFMVSDTSIPGQDNPSPNAGGFIARNKARYPHHPAAAHQSVSTTSRLPTNGSKSTTTSIERIGSATSVMPRSSISSRTCWCNTCCSAKTIRGCSISPICRDYSAGRSLLGDLHDQRSPSTPAGSRRRSSRRPWRTSKPGRQSHALQRLRRLGHRRSQRQHHHRACHQRGDPCR